MNEYTTEWTGHYPCLCYGEWKLFRNGEDISDMIPEELRKRSMNTNGEYAMWSFGEDWSEEWDTYEDGLSAEEWIKENSEWLSKITEDKAEQEEIYFAFNENDFRWGSCGGCI